MPIDRTKGIDTGGTIAPPAHDQDGLSFTPNGFIGKWNSGLFSLFYTEIDPAPYQPNLVVPTQSGKFALYYKDPTAAKAAAEKYKLDAGLEKPPIVNEIWRLSAPVASLKNVDQSKFDRNPYLSFDVRVTGPRSEHRHAYQLMAIPGAVRAAAIFAGAEELTSLHNPMLELLLSNAEFTAENFARLVGNPKAKPGEPGYWLDSELGQFRVQLWKACGEPDPLKTTNTKVPTESEDLIYCLTAVGTWQRPQWARVVLVPDPDPGAVFNEKQQRVAVVWEFFENEKAASDVGAAELARRVSAAPTETDIAPTEAGAEPKVPPEWAEIPDEWRSAIATELETGREVRDIAATLSVGVPFVVAWKKYLGK